MVGGEGIKFHVHLTRRPLSLTKRAIILIIRIIQLLVVQMKRNILKSRRFSHLPTALKDNNVFMYQIL